MASLFAAPAARVTYVGVMSAEVAVVVLPVLATALPVMAGLRACSAACLITAAAGYANGAVGACPASRCRRERGSFAVGSNGSLSPQTA